jgi:hydrogenase maturation protease
MPETVRPRLILGLGSPHGDDVAGWLTIDALHRHGVPRSAARRVSDPTDLWNWVMLETDLLLIDACTGTGPVGTLRKHDWPQMVLPSHGPRNSHRFPLGEALALGRTLQLCPATVTVWTIEGQRFDPEMTPDAAVAAAAERLAESLVRGVHDA